VSREELPEGGTRVGFSRRRANGSSIGLARGMTSPAADIPRARKVLGGMAAQGGGNRFEILVFATWFDSGFDECRSLADAESSEKEPTSIEQPRVSNQVVRSLTRRTMKTKRKASWSRARSRGRMVPTKNARARPRWWRAVSQRVPRDAYRRIATTDVLGLLSIPGEEMPCSHIESSFVSLTIIERS